MANPLGAYYLYFAHHRGKYIRLAYADEIAGPWTVYAPGTLKLADCPAVKGHLASPDIRIDETGRQILMYFHGHSAGERDIQRTFVAHSGNAIDFVASDEDLGPAYSRNFFHDGFQYMVMGARGFRVFRSGDGAGPWEKGPTVLPKDEVGETEGRHCALLKRGNKLLVFYTRKGDAPESILAGVIDLAADWMEWKVVGDQVVLKPEENFEGASEPVSRSRSGPSTGEENALRDPAIYEEDGRVWMVYAFAGEQGLALAELTIGEFTQC
ncbi:MAG: hypothetical protein NTV73_02785 [Hyphomicrobiales bacterium]|nr:hypothetical protein [Hyphomicrobiales bacterium]